MLNSVAKMLTEKRVWMWRLSSENNSPYAEQVFFNNAQCPRLFTLTESGDASASEVNLNLESVSSCFRLTIE